MKKLIIALCICVSMVTLFAADEAATTNKPSVKKLSGAEATTQLNRIFGNGDEYSRLAKEIERLKTGTRLNADREIALAKAKQQAIIDKIKAVQTDDLPALQLQARMLEQLKRGRKLSSDEAERIDYWAAKAVQNAEINKTQNNK